METLFTFANSPMGTTTISCDGNPVAVVPTVLEGIDMANPATLASPALVNAWLTAAAEYRAKHQPGCP